MTEKLRAALEPVEAMRQACIAAVRAEQKYEGSDFPVCNAIVHAIEQIPALRASTDAAVMDELKIEEAEMAGMDKAATFCIETLAKALGIGDWQMADGSEEWHGDVAGTIYNVLKAGRVYDDEDGRVARLEDARPPVSDAAAEPVAYRYVHLDYAGRKVSRCGSHPERVNGHDPIEIHPLYAHPPADALREAINETLLDRAELAWQRFFYPANDCFDKTPAANKLPAVDLEIADCLRLLLAAVGRNVREPQAGSVSLAALSEAPSAGEGIDPELIERVRYAIDQPDAKCFQLAKAAMTRHDFRRIHAALSHPAPAEPVGHWHGKDADDMLARFRKKDAEPAGLRSRDRIALAICNEQRRAHGLPPFNALEDMEPHHYRDQLRWADAVLSTLTRTDEASTNGEGRS